jgi:OCT family organic cation transporter-like MFS transporter 4/5
VAPLVLLLFSWKLLPESPRWLISKSKTKEATAILRTIAESNGVTPPADLGSRVEKIALANKETSLGYLSLFCTPVLAGRTVAVTIGFTASAFVYYQMVINVSNMVGNTFLNLFLLGLVEGPGNVLGTVLANKIGRRWTHSGLLFINSLLFMTVMLLVPYQTSTTWAPTMVQVLCMVLKMNISATFVVAYIQVTICLPDP